LNPPERKTVTHRILTLLKYLIPLVVIGWLLISQRQQLVEFWQQEKRWPALIAGFAVAFVAVGLSFLRWYVLVRALQLPFRLADAFRLGFLGYLLTFISGGSVGGDLFKAVFVAHEQPGRRTEAVATVFVDRVVGMFSLLVLTSIAVLCFWPAATTPLVQTICRATLAATGAAIMVAALVLVPRGSLRVLRRLMVRVPRLGPILDRLIHAVQSYRGKPGTLAAALGISLSVHGLLTVSVYLAAVSLLQAPPTLAEHLIVVPLSVVAGTLPITPGGLGTVELIMQQLYLYVPEPGNEQGIVVALAYRLMTILIAVAGAGYYLTSRREVRELWEEAEREAAEGEDSAPPESVNDRAGSR
jgi:uncharacterized protein (TIRG00374 family)